MSKVESGGIKPVDWCRGRVQCYDSWDDTKSGVAEIVASADSFMLTSHQHPLIADFSALSDRRTVAARALYEQPFGFTWADVDLLAAEADVLEMVTLPLLRTRGDAEHIARVEAKARGLRRLAARIAALLPPPLVSVAK